MDVPTIIIVVFSFLFALTVHEASHAWAAYKLGDPTAYSMGRVSFNPLAHIDPIGTVIFPFIMLIMGLVPIGWAKPVPVNPLNLRNPRRDNLWISAAGPASNLTVATISLILIVFLKLINPNVVYFLRANLYQMGGFSRGFYPLGVLALILYFMAYVNCLLAIFNLIPIPPLDGSGVLMGFLSEEAIQKYERIRPFGFIILLALIYLGILRILMMPVFIVINAIALS